MTPLTEILGLFLLLAGFVLGLGAVTVIDVMGFLARESTYWTETVIRAHKVTKPLIWIGISLAVIGGRIFYAGAPLLGIPLTHLLLAILLILNGCFLTCVVSPYLLKQEAGKRSKKLLPPDFQTNIAISFLVSIVAWWGSLILLVLYLVDK